MRGFVQVICTASAVLVCIGVSNGQFVAFNDHAPGPGTSPFTTTWNAEGNSPGRTGLLMDVSTGRQLSVRVTIAANGNATYEGAQGNPAPGTPLYNTFHGFVDFGGSPNPALALNGAGAAITYTFTGLDPSKRYNFAGSAVRANAYSDRWSLFELAGADSFVSAHTINALTTDIVPSIAANQVAINTGINDTPETGDMAQWLNIDPGSDGVLSVNSYQYLGIVPGGSSGGAKGYGMTGFRLEEFVVPEPSSVSIFLLASAGVLLIHRSRAVLRLR
jgi:hypothetical protein